MSGGERRRVALAALLVRRSDLLVLDEPTNHLDVAAVTWLARYLRRGAARCGVTHDRWFLDAVCDPTWEVADGAVRAYEGGYAAYVLARAERARHGRGGGRRQNLLRKEIAWLRRGPPARTTKPKFRIEAANALIADVPPPRDQVALRRLATARLGKQVYELESVTRTVDGRTMLDRVDWLVGPGDRVGDRGRQRRRQDAPCCGCWRGRSPLMPGGPGGADGPAGVPVAGTGRVAERAAGTLTAVEQVARRVTLGDKDLSAAQLAEVFGFTGDRLWTPVGDLSGGERRRLQLLRLLAAEPNVLLLDEPTNDLDTDTLAALEDLLDDWPGTLIVASHDRYLVERVADQVYGMFGDGRLTHLPGGVDEYLARVAESTPPSGEGRTGADQPPGERARGRPPGAGGAQRAARKELARLERQLDKLTAREAELHAQLAAHATDYPKLTELTAQLTQVRADRERVEEAWLALAEQLADA